jgi:hypothetical protein
MDAAGLEIEMEALAADGAGAAFQLTFPRSRYTDHWLYKQWFAEPWSGARETEVLNGVSSFKVITQVRTGPRKKRRGERP